MRTRVVAVNLPTWTFFQAVRLQISVDQSVASPLEKREHNLKGSFVAKLHYGKTLCSNEKAENPFLMSGNDHVHYN